VLHDGFRIIARKKLNGGRMSLRGDLGRAGGTSS